MESAGDFKKEGKKGRKKAAKAVKLARNVFAFGLGKNKGARERSTASGEEVTPGGGSGGVEEPRRRKFNLRRPSSFLGKRIVKKKKLRDRVNGASLSIYTTLESLKTFDSNISTGRCELRFNEHFGGHDDVMTISTFLRTHGKYVNFLQYEENGTIRCLHLQTLLFVTDVVLCTRCHRG